jgi:hypothetical protein
MKTFLAFEKYLSDVEHVSLLNFNQIHIKAGVSLTKNVLTASCIMQNFFLLEVSEGFSDFFVVGSHMATQNLLHENNKRLVIDIGDMLAAIAKSSGLTTNHFAINCDTMEAPANGPFGGFKIRSFCSRHLVENLFEKMILCGPVKCNPQLEINGRGNLFIFSFLSCLINALFLFSQAQSTLAAQN